MAVVVVASPERPLSSQAARGRAVLLLGFDLVDRRHEEDLRQRELAGRVVRDLKHLTHPIHTTTLQKGCQSALLASN